MYILLVILIIEIIKVSKKKIVTDKKLIQTLMTEENFFLRTCKKYPS